MAETSTVDLHWFWVPWVAGGFAGSRRLRAPDAASAEHDLATHPSDFGLPCESVVVGRALRCVTIEPRPDAARAD